jgi:hypothetical protein
MILCGAEHQGLFPLVDHGHKEFDPLLLSLLDLDDFIKVGFLVALAEFYFTFMTLSSEV